MRARIAVLCHPPPLPAPLGPQHWSCAASCATGHRRQQSARPQANGGSSRPSLRARRAVLCQSAAAVAGGDVSAGAPSRRWPLGSQPPDLRRQLRRRALAAVAGHRRDAGVVPLLAVRHARVCRQTGWSNQERSFVRLEPWYFLIRLGRKHVGLYLTCNHWQGRVCNAPTT